MMAIFIKLMGKLGFAILFVIALPFSVVALIINTVSGGKAFAKFFADADGLANEQANLKRIKAQVVTSTPSLDELTKVRAQVKRLVAKKNWLALSDLIQDWDQNRTVCCANVSYAETAMQEVLERQAVNIYEGHTCHPDPIMLFRDETVEKFEALAAENFDRYPLLAIEIAARLLNGLDPVALDAPLLAETRHKLLAFMPNAHRYVKNSSRNGTSWRH